MADDLPPPKKSQTVYKPPSVSETRRRAAKEGGLRLQADQSEDERAGGVQGHYRPTQDWTGYHAALNARVAAEQRALGHGRDEDAIAAIMGHRPQESYTPSPEAMAFIESYEADNPVEAEVVEELSLEEREARVAAREAKLDAEEERRSREEALRQREKAADDRERSLSVYDQAVAQVPEDLDDLDHLRNFRPAVDAEVTFRATNAPPPTWEGGRRRMTANERAHFEAEGMELFGIDPAQGSAWSRLNNLDPVGGLPKPAESGPTHHYQGNSEAERIAALAQERQYTDDADGAAQAAADAFLYGEQVQQQRRATYDEQVRKEQEDYDKRQADAQATVDAFIKGRGSMDF